MMVSDRGLPVDDFARDHYGDASSGGGRTEDSLVIGGAAIHHRLNRNNCISIVYQNGLFLIEIKTVRP